MPCDSMDSAPYRVRVCWKWAFPISVVKYPARISMSPTVGTSSKSLVPSVHAPCWDGYIPVMMLARVGVQVGLGQ